MAKEIKAIKCPNCGSVSKTEIKPDYFRCNSCQTEYFLDNSDVNINYNHNYNNSNNLDIVNPKAVKIIGIVVGCIFGLIVLTNILSSIFSRKPSSTNSTYSASSIISRDHDQGFYASRYTSLPFLRPSNKQPIVLMLENRNYKDQQNESEDGTYLAFYDPVKKELISEEKVSSKRLSSSDFKFKKFSDGNIYIVNDKSTFMKLDVENLKTIEVGKSFFDGHADLQIGVATMEFVYSNNGDGLVLLTNDGKKRYYYPLIQKIYNEKDYYKSREGFDNLLPTATNKTKNLFTSQSTEYPEDKVQLIQLTYKDNGPGPKEIPNNISWRKDYGGSGIFTGNDPYRKVLVGAWKKEDQRILNWKDLTPERLYFSPSVKLDEGGILLIQFRADANTKSAFKLQQVNPQNGAVIWTVNLPDEKTIDELIKYKDGFLAVLNDDSMMLLDEKGIVKSTYKLK